MSKPWRKRLSIASVFLGLYLVVVWGVGCTDFFILHPSRNAIAVPDSRQVIVPLPDGTKSEIYVGRTRIRATEEDLAYVLEFSPNAGRGELGLLYGIGKWEGMPIEYWSLNYPGYGGSEGKATLAGVHVSALAAYDELAKHANGKPIFLSGYSLGTTAALYVAAHRPVAGLYLYQPPPLRQLILEKHGWWNLWLLAYPVARGVPAELDSLANAANTRAPAFYVLGERDTYVDYGFQKRVAAAHAGETRVLPLPVTHNDDPEEIARGRIREGIVWLWERGVIAPTDTARAGATTLPTTAPARP